MIRKPAIPITAIVVLFIAGLLLRPQTAPTAQGGFTPTAYVYLPYVRKDPTPTPTSTPTLTPTPTPTPTKTPTPTPTKTPTPTPTATTFQCRVYDAAWSKSDNQIRILFEVEGSDMIVSFEVTYIYLYDSQFTTRFFRRRNLREGTRWYSYYDGLSSAWQPIALDIRYEECVD